LEGIKKENRYRRRRQRKLQLLATLHSNMTHKNKNNFFYCCTVYRYFLQVPYLYTVSNWGVESPWSWWSPKS
jgi:hypothetical protein